MKAYPGKILWLILMIAAGCNSPENRKPKEFISFKPVNGIYFTEVNRRSANGLSFDKYGFQQEPQWRMRFISDDSVSVYSPDKKQYLNFLLSRGYDSIFNTARAWLKMKKLSKDSMVFQLLTAHSDSLDTNGEDVYMTLYADDYIKNVLHTTAKVLQRPTRKDTLFVRSLVQKANADTNNAFAARQTVQFISKNPKVTATQRKTIPDYLNNNFSVTADYFDPVYDITIKDAYKDFYYTFTMIVDGQGKMYYRKPLVGFLPGDEHIKEEYIRQSTGVMNSYMAYYFDVIPGSTLGMPHASIISLKVRGIAKK